MGITKEQYEAAIPKCCAYQTIEAHESIMLCWGLAAAVERGEKMNCDNCTENTMKVGDDGTAVQGDMLLPANVELMGPEAALSPAAPSRLTG